MQHAEDVDVVPTPYRLCSTCDKVLAKSAHLNGRADMLEATQVHNQGLQRVQTLSHLKKQDLEASANSGCHLCSLLCEQFDRSHDSDYSGRLELRIQSYPESWGNITMGLVRRTDDITGGKMSEWLLKVDVRPEGSDYLQEHGWRDFCADDDVRLASSTASTVWFNKVVFWLQRCLREHSDCRIYMTYAVLPARLIDVGQSGTSGSSLRLCLTDTLQEKPRYLTLSHCWGSAEFLQLQRGNLDQFLDNIPEGNLPATFTDAVTVTRRLGYQYLWIDSLCIVQDSVDDWNRESAKMGDVYHYSDLTISALWGNDPQTGLFTRRNPLKFLTCVLTNVVHRLVISHAKSTLTLEGPLLKRAWVFQESTLSPRNLFYGVGTVFWECLNCDANECFDWTRQLSIPLQAGADANPKQMLYNMKRSFSKSSWMDEGTFYGPYTSLAHEYWCELRERYTKLTLTKKSDKLVAINGIMKAVTLDSAAGLIKEMILPDLLWYVKSATAQKLGSYESYRAPSWSWASVDDPASNKFPMWARDLADDGDYGSDYSSGSYHWLQCPAHWASEIVDINVTQGANGAVSRGQIVLRGPVQRIQLRKNLDPKIDQWHADFAGIDLGSGEQYAVLIARVGKPNKSLQEQYHDFFLVLEKMDGQDGVFRRIGYLEQWFFGSTGQTKQKCLLLEGDSSAFDLTTIKLF